MSEDLNLQFARGGAQFTVDLLEKLKASATKKNIIISPFSIQTCMALAFAGAQGDTAQEIATVMKYNSNSKHEIAQKFRAVLDQYQNSELLKIANKIYVKENKSIKAEFATTAKEQYHAQAEAIDFSESQAAAQTINSWVEHKTLGKIKNLISSDVLNEDTRLVLLNALHFKADWASKFDEANTVEDDFWFGPEQSVKVKYMQQTAYLGCAYLHQYKCYALEMPYDDSDLSMFVLLPDKREGLMELMEQLKDINLIDLSNRMSVNEVMVKLPKFKTDYSIELKDVLQEMGIKKAFGAEADFSGMLEPAENVSISNVIHKASIEVNEKGSEASAATGAVMMARCALVMEFVADHPFLYWIWNKRNVLFAGAFVNAPKET